MFGLILKIIKRGVKIFEIKFIKIKKNGLDTTDLFFESSLNTFFNKLIYMTNILYFIKIIDYI